MKSSTFPISIGELNRLFGSLRSWDSSGDRDIGESGHRKSCLGSGDPEIELMTRLSERSGSIDNADPSVLWTGRNYSAQRVSAGSGERIDRARRGGRGMFPSKVSLALN